MTITEFLEARIAEDEATARAAEESPIGAGPKWVGCFRQIEGTGHAPVADTHSSWYADHIVRHDPARVLAECAAKRAIIEQHLMWVYTDEEPGFSMILWDCMCNRQMSKPCPTIAALAAVYADHPDYQQEWAL